MVATEYNKAVMGSIEFMIGYDGNLIPRREIVNLIDESITTLNESNKVIMGDNFEIYFHLDNIEDETWHELNSLVRLAYNRRNREMSPVRVVHHYLTSKELDRFSRLTDKLAGETS